MPWQLVSVYRNVSSGPLYGVAGAMLKGSTEIVGLLPQLELAGEADALVVVTKLAPPTATVAMAARPIPARQRRRRCLPISRMMRSLHEQVPT